MSKQKKVKPVIKPFSDEKLSHIEIWKYIKENNHKECYRCGSKKVIKAHSIQEAILKQLCSEQDGLVVTRAYDSTAAKCVFTEIGIGKMSTFPGFCGEHDTKIFSGIENQGMELGNQEHEFLLCYRSFAREYNTINHKYNVAKKLFDDASKSNTSIPELVRLGLSHNQALRQAQYQQRIRDRMNKALDEKDYGLISTFSLTLNSNFNLCASSMFMPEFDLNDARINDPYKNFDTVDPVAFTILPRDNKSILLISCFIEAQEKFQTYFNQIAELDEERLTKYLSGVLLFHCENFAMALNRWNQLDDSVKSQMDEVFEATLNLDPQNPNMFRDLKPHLFNGYNFLQRLKTS